MFRKLLLFKFAPESKDLALLFLRVIAAVNILLKHGLEKVLDYQGMYLRLSANHFYVIPLGVGISLFCATVADAILTVPLALGLATRWCALLCFVNLAVAWSMVGHFIYNDPHNFIGSTHGELVVSYLASLIALAFAGGGKYSIDTLIDR